MRGPRLRAVTVMLLCATSAAAQPTQRGLVELGAGLRFSRHGYTDGLGDRLDGSGRAQRLLHLHFGIEKTHCLDDSASAPRDSRGVSLGAEARGCKRRGIACAALGLDELWFARGVPCEPRTSGHDTERAVRGSIEVGMPRWAVLRGAVEGRMLVDVQTANALELHIMAGVGARL